MVAHQSLSNARSVCTWMAISTMCCLPLARPPSSRACNDWDKAEEILSMMKSRGVQPNEVTYTELISICGRSGDVHQALVS